VRILITGGAGFVGRYFVKRFYDEHELHVIDKVYGQTAQQFFGMTEHVKYDLIIHLAAMVGGRAKIDGDPLAIAENLAIDSDMFRWAIRTKQPRVVYYSSSAAYPVAFQDEDRKWRLREDDIWLGPETIGRPDQTYGWAKLTGEVLAQHAEAEGVRVHIFRPFSGYGSDQSLDYPFPSFIDRAKRRVPVFDIWGTGQQTRDFIHIDDIVEATLEAVRQDVPGPVNLGNGRATSFLDLAQMVTQAAGYSPDIRLLTDKPMGCFYRVASPEKMLSFYTPRISLEEGIDRALQGI
jgi:nucleoside-diphosphate-sugar epimerase